MLSNKYEIIRTITKGTFSTLYEGIHIYKKNKVAIKVESDPISKKILDHEIEIYLYLKKYKNIRIPTIKCIGTFKEYSYIVMELLDINLRDHVKNGLSKMDFIYMIEQIITLMKDFHERELFHRDIKPENFVLDKNKNICIIDLGLSCFNDYREMSQFIGNKRYSSYNCHKDKYIYTKEDDLISVIYMLLDLYTGILPWTNNINYKIKKDTNYLDFYNSIEKYDSVVKLILHIYSQIGSRYFYRDILYELCSTINYCES